MNDLISRQAAIDAMNAKLEDIKLRWKGKVKKGEIAMYLDMRGTIETLPSAQPQRIVGHWIKTDYPSSKCSVCGRFSDAYKANFCPKCGAKMDEKEGQR